MSVIKRYLLTALGCLAAVLYLTITGLVFVGLSAYAYRFFAKL